MEGRQEVHTIRSEEEVIVVHDGEPVSVVDCANGVIKCHGLDVETGQDCLLVSHGGVIMRGNLTLKINYFQILLISLLTFADRMTHISHKFILTALKSALLRGDPCR